MSAEKIKAKLTRDVKRRMNQLVDEVTMLVERSPSWQALDVLRGDQRRLAVEMHLLALLRQRRTRLGV